jgi:hypothetical protein
MRHPFCTLVAGCALAALATAACGGAPAPAASTPAMPSAAPSAGADAPAASQGPSADPVAPAAGAGEVVPAHVPGKPSDPTKRQKLKVAPYTIALPDGSTVEKEDGPVPADVVSLGGSGTPITIGPRSSVGYKPLEDQLNDLAREHINVVFKEGKGSSYVIIYQPSKTSRALQYTRYFTIDGKDLECEAGGIYETAIDDYHAACTSVRK